MSARVTATFLNRALRSLQLEDDQQVATDSALRLTASLWVLVLVKDRSVQSELAELWSEQEQNAYSTRHALGKTEPAGQRLTLTFRNGSLVQDRSGYRLGSRTSQQELVAVAQHLTSLLLRDPRSQYRARVGWSLALLASMKFPGGSWPVQQTAHLGEAWLESDEPVEFYGKSRQSFVSAPSGTPALVEAEAAANAQFFDATCNAYSAILSEDGDIFAKMYYLQAARGILHGFAYGDEVLERRLALAAEAGHRWRVAEALATLEDPLSVDAIKGALQKAVAERASRGRQLNPSHVAEIALKVTLSGSRVETGSRGNLIPGEVFFHAGYHWTVRGIRDSYPEVVRALFQTAFRAGATYRDAERLLLTDAEEPQVENDSKICPDCAETVKGSARVCRFCRFSFAE